MYFCHLILMGRSMESYIDPFAPGFSYTWRTWLTKDGSKVFQFTWWSYVVVHVIRICFLFLYINNKWKYIHYRFGKQAKLELSYFFFKSRYSGLDWHPPVTEAATARPFTSNNMTSLVGPANHNFSTRRYKAFFHLRVFNICFIIRNVTRSGRRPWSRWWWSRYSSSESSGLVKGEGGNSLEREWFHGLT